VCLYSIGATDQALDDMSCHTDDNNNEIDEISDLEDFEDSTVTARTVPYNDDLFIGYGQSTPRSTLEEAIVASDEEDTSQTESWTRDGLPIINVTDDVTDDVELSVYSVDVQRKAALSGCDSTEDSIDVVEESKEREDSLCEVAMPTSEDRVLVGTDNNMAVGETVVDLRLAIHYANDDVDSGEDSGSGVGSSVTDEEDLDNDIDCSGSRMKIRETLTPVNGIIADTVAEAASCRLMTSKGPSMRGPIASNKDESAYTSSSGLYDEFDNDTDEDDKQVEP